MRIPVLIPGALALGLALAGCHKPAQENAVESGGATSTANVMAPSNGTGGDMASGNATGGNATGGDAGGNTTTGNVSSGAGSNGTGSGTGGSNTTG